MKKNPVLIILGILVGLNVLAWVTVYDLSRPQLLEVTFFACPAEAPRSQV